MNARKYRVKLNLSPLDFPAFVGLAKQSDFTKTEPPLIVHNKVVLKITKKLILIETYTNKEHEVFSVESIYEIPAIDIKTRADIYEVYKDAALGLSEAYHYVQKKMPLPTLLFPTQQIEIYQKEIDAVFYLLNTRN
ncbi:MAG: hypothetical protein ING84_08490 [Cytophagales bacterium]|jgi:hypothetical protein|nr:hypothetical protein [Cytophagales bacterium]MCA6366100.1 hypothetical protein [Cytophagales bacterium]MCA6373055.1 hypothetical protein [Cytophagales bacterium]MCA6375935.1 hypothetical protein [Cytophagales bacterium]MCA6383520.1 hypothetical protein [Cytophagales bacterium]